MYEKAKNKSLSYFDFIIPDNSNDMKNNSLALFLSENQLNDWFN